jgi:hypothetical protein
MTKGDLISREKAINAVYGMVRPTGIDELPYEYAEGVINDLPSADIMECARAIKEYCDKTRCEKCELAEHKVMNDTDNYLCRVHYLRPECWDLPEERRAVSE